MSADIYRRHNFVEFVDELESELQTSNYAINSDRLAKRFKIKISKPVDGGFTFHEISIDIVLTNIQQGDVSNIALKNNNNNEFYVVFDQPQDKYSWIGWTEPHATITFARTESDKIQTSPPVIKATYMVCKRIIKYFTHKQYFTSNVLKTAVLYCIAEADLSQCSSSEFTKEELLQWVQQVLHQLLQFAIQDYVLCYSLPKLQLPVWKFENYLKFSHTRVHLHGLTFQDFFETDFFERHKEKLKDFQLRNIMKAFPGQSPGLHRLLLAELMESRN